MKTGSILDTVAQEAMRLKAVEHTSLLKLRPTAKSQAEAKERMAKKLARQQSFRTKPQ